MDVQIIWVASGLLILNLCFILISKSPFLFRFNVTSHLFASHRNGSFIKLKPKASWLIPALMLIVVTSLNYVVVSSTLFNSNNEMSGETLLEIDSPYNLRTTVENIELAIGNSNNRFIRKQYVDNGFITKSHQSKKEVAVYFCNFELLNKSLGTDKRMGVFLPFQVTAIERKGRVKIVALNPKQLGRKLLGHSEINGTLNEVYDAYVEILNEATI